MANTIKFTEIDRPISTPADKLEDEANDILADVVYGKSPYADELEAQAGSCWSRLRRCASSVVDPGLKSI